MSSSGECSSTNTIIVHRGLHLAVSGVCVKTEPMSPVPSPESDLSLPDSLVRDFHTKPSPCHIITRRVCNCYMDEIFMSTNHKA